MSKSNFIVSLAPYCLPIYTLFILLAYLVARQKYSQAFLEPLLIGAVGFTLSFHASLTLYAIRQNQPDIVNSGPFFSLIFIVLANAWIIILLAKILFSNEISLLQFLTLTAGSHKNIWQFIFTELSQRLGKAFAKV